ncbi:hypothetical protein Nepgr_006669 [Nepenthes gracilis]|uniref:Uncharacterized protein n=1 Tax=Nepenthes gracilis TaxID=150966 RepID=A0AAD3XHK5_NEPGR|nr:hypothetical protein Nepgr_006669 [Nepenthes gracilis]
MLRRVLLTKVNEPISEVAVGNGVASSGAFIDADEQHFLLLMAFILAIRSSCAGMDFLFGVLACGNPVPSLSSSRFGHPDPLADVDNSVWCCSGMGLLTWPTRPWLLAGGFQPVGLKLPVWHADFLLCWYGLAEVADEALVASWRLSGPFGSNCGMAC